VDASVLLDFGDVGVEVAGDDRVPDAVVDSVEACSTRESESSSLQSCSVSAMPVRLCERSACEGRGIEWCAWCCCC
jgi:hypothetical protein